MSTEVVYLQRYLVVTWLVLRETAAVSARVLCTPYNHTRVYNASSYRATCISGVHVCFSLNLHFSQNDRNLLRASAVTRGWNGYRKKSRHRKLTPEKKILARHSCRDSNPRLFDHEPGALPLSYPRSPFHRGCGFYTHLWVFPITAFRMTTLR